MEALEATLRSIEKDGLTWGSGKLVPLAFGIKKLQVNFVVEDEKVSIDELQAQIEEDEEHVQSTDVVSSQPSPSIGNVDPDFSSLGCYDEAIITRLLCRDSQSDAWHAIYFKCCATRQARLVPIIEP